MRVLKKTMKQQIKSKFNRKIMSKMNIKINDIFILITIS